MVERDRFVAVAGALAIAVAVTGLLVVEARAGPFEHVVEPATHPTVLSGVVISSSGPPGGVGREGCSIVAPSPLCSEPRTEVELRLTGLPVLEAPARYAAILSGPSRTVSLGALTWDGQAYTLARVVDGEASGLDRLVLALADREMPDAPSNLTLHEEAVDVEEEGTQRLSARFTPAPGTLRGLLETAQIGAVEVSATAVAALEDLPDEPGWRYHAWFVDDDRGRHVALGELASDGQGAWRLDARVERVILADQDRFLVTVDPVASEPPSAPTGFPVVDLTL